MKSVLFVCTGNICRSPTAEAVFRHKVMESGQHERFFIDSAGTHGYHVGHPPDHRSVMVAKSRGINMNDLAARKLDVRDFEKFDLLLAMDQGHFHDMTQLKPPGSPGEVELFLNYHPEFKGQSVADPYYGNMDGFEEVFDLVEDACEHLLKALV